MKLAFAILALAVALHAEDQLPTCASNDCPTVTTKAQPLATVEQLQKQVAEQKQEIAKLQQKMDWWSQRAAMCEAAPTMKRTIEQTNAQLDAQIDAQAKAKQEKAAK